MGIIGFILGVKGQDTAADEWWTVLGVVWAASIGFGFGSIFDQRFPTKRLVIYWAATLALVGPFVGLLVDAGLHPDTTRHQQTLAVCIGAAIGILLGALVGVMQWHGFRRRSGTP